MAQELLFGAIENENVELVQEAIANGAELNALSRRGTALYRSVKLHNFKISKLLMECGADCNIVQLDFNLTRTRSNDGLDYLCVISTPIDLLCEENNINHDEILKYLLENRPMVNEKMIEQRIYYCQRLFDDGNHEALFDYATSCFLRKNMYDHLYPLGRNVLLMMVAAALNIDATLQNKRLDNGGTHEAFFTLTIRSLFEELVRFKLGRAFNIESEQQYAHILHELIHNLEAYNLLMDINRIPDNRAEFFYPSIVKNIIKKLREMEPKEEYTLPMRWEEHAVCLSFVRESNSIVIRIDNLNIGEIEKHTPEYNTDDSLIMIPAIIGEILLDQLEENENYFKSLLRCMKQLQVKRTVGIQTLYHNTELKNLDRSRVSMMTEQLKLQSNALKCFIEQAQNNCFFKSHEPGFAIRSNDVNIFQKVIAILRVYATKLTENSTDIRQKRNEFESKLFYYWENEPTIKFNAEYAAQLHQHVVVWVDKHIGAPGNNEQMKQRFRRITYPLHTFTNAADAISFICTQQDIKTSVFLIVSGTLGEEIMPIICNFSCIVQIYIFCGNIAACMNWAEPYIDKILMFDFDEELLIRLTNDIANYLVDVATKEKARGEEERAAGLLDWADWLYHDATTCQQAFCQRLRAQIRQERRNLNINQQIPYPNRFSA